MFLVLGDLHFVMQYYMISCICHAYTVRQSTAYGNEIQFFLGQVSIEHVLAAHVQKTPISLALCSRFCISTDVVLTCGFISVAGELCASPCFPRHLMLFWWLYWRLVTVSKVSIYYFSMWWTMRGTFIQSECLTLWTHIPIVAKDFSSFSFLLLM